MVDANEREIDGFLENPEETPKIPGVISALVELKPDSVVTEESLTHIFGKHQTSIKRAIERGELPRPVRMFGKPTWTVRTILAHLEERMRYEAEASDESAEILAKYRPDWKG
jgi:predicted DNA-binding transcriptional regulator AlpA